MEYSKLFGKTVKGTPTDMKTASHKLLYQAGYVRESTAGRYYFLPLGIRVHEKIRQVIKQEMDRAGAQELVTPVLHPLELWKETNRNKSAGYELMNVKDRRGAAFALGGTAEEMMIDLVRKFQISYKDLPFNIYQFSTKFRDELRARGGLLRVREFTMKDAYSFHADEKDFKHEYKNMRDTYSRIFKRLGLETVIVESDNGYIGGEYCHEFVVESEVGESRYLTTEDGTYAAHEDVAVFKKEQVNVNEEMKNFQMIEQPEWVKTMDDNIKHYKKDKRHFLKNVVYRTSEGDVVIAVIRGDLDVNKVKLEHLVGMGSLEAATEEDLQAIGSQAGWVHSWGHEFTKLRKAVTEKREANVIYVADDSLHTVRNFIGGHKEKTRDSINVNYGRDFKHNIEGDIAMAQDGFLTRDGKKLIEKRGIEVGNIFQLGYHYSNLMKGAVFTDAEGKEQKYYMGCYGIGIGRTMAALVEKHYDERGITWPEVVAPYSVYLVEISNGKPDVNANAEKLYKTLTEHGVDVLWDDRENVSAGAKFADADLIGIPVRLVVSEKTEEKVEWKERNKKEANLISIEELLKKLAA